MEENNKIRILFFSGILILLIISIFLFNKINYKNKISTDTDYEYNISFGDSGVGGLIFALDYL